MFAAFRIVLFVLFCITQYCFANIAEQNNIEFADWQKALGQESVQLVYSGPYNGNPASLFGHIFLKFTNTNNLLSYTVAFVANTEDDSDVLTVWKGLTGGYTASFSINPYYINTALYNNSESRDLWEYPLNLTHLEIQNLQKMIWNAQYQKSESYYFFTQNCAYKMLDLFDRLRPNLRLKSQASLLIIPLDIVKIFQKNALIDDSKINQRKSIHKHLEEKLRTFNTQQTHHYLMAKTNTQNMDSINDIEVLDALIDHWKFRNYKKKLVLSKEESQLFEKTLVRRSAVTNQILVSRDTLASAAQLYSARQTEESPHLSHQTSWVSFGGEFDSRDKIIMPTFSFRLGVHSLSSSSKGLVGNSFMEYLGIDYGSKLKIIPFSIYSLDDFYFAEPQFSWKIGSQFQNANHRMAHYFDEQYQFILESGMGLSNRVVFAFIGPTLYKGSQHSEQEWSLMPQLELGCRYELSHLLFLIQYKDYFKNKIKTNSALIKIAYKLSNQSELISSFENEQQWNSKLELQLYF